VDSRYGLLTARQEDKMTREELLNILTRYEGAIQVNNDEGDEASILELEEAREKLMDVLLEAKKVMGS
jgi:hypothetical protein